MVNRRRAVRVDAAPPSGADDGRWHELLAIAARIFARKGYRSTTLQDIADEFGVLKGSLYHYITSKDELLFEVVSTVYAKGLGNLRSIVDSDLEPVERLRAVVRGHVLHLIENLVETTVLLHEVEQLSPERRALIPVRDYQGMVADLIADAVASDPRFKPGVDPQVAALTVLGATNWIYRWYRAGGRSPQEIADQLADHLVDGLLVCPGRDS